MPQLQALAGDSEALPTGNTEHTRPENRLYFPALDGLRTLAVAIVFVGHYFHMPWGYTGVTLFFVLSGFLITGILYDTRDQPHRARNFYIRRTLRIFPLYYGVFLALLLLTPVLHPHWTTLWWAWPAYLGNLLRLIPSSAIPGSVASDAANGWLAVGSHLHYPLFLGHFWSLCLEEQFYLLWPWVVFAAYTWRRLVWICVAVLIVSPIVRIFAGAVFPHIATDLVLYSFTFFRLDALLIGGLLALLIRSSYRDRVLLLARRFLFVASIVLIPAFLYSLRSRWNDYTYPYARLTWGESLLGLVFAALVATALCPDSLVYRIFNLRPLRALGRITYGIYVFHDIPHNAYRVVALRLARHNHFFASHLGLVTSSLGIVCTLLFAWLSFRFFETPFLNLKERWAPSHRISNPPLAAAQLTSQPS